MFSNAVTDTQTAVRFRPTDILCEYSYWLMRFGLCNMALTIYGDIRNKLNKHTANILTFKIKFRYPKVSDCKVMCI